MIPPRAAPDRRAPAPARLRVLLLAVPLAALLLAGCGGAGGETRVKGQWDMDMGMQRAR